MTGRDWLTAVIAAIVLMALGVAAAFGWVAIYSHVINPGQPFEVYEAYADKYAPWVSLYSGVPIWLLAGWWLARGRERGRAVDTMFGTAFVYTVLDLSIMAAVGALSTIIGMVIVSVTTKALAGAAGAMAGARG